MRDGFGNRVLFRLAEDLRERLPALLSHRTLVDIRSYKVLNKLPWVVRRSARCC